MTPLLQTLAWVFLGVLIGGSVGYVLGYVRAAEESEVAIRLLQIEWQSTLRALAKEEEVG